MNRTICFFSVGISPRALAYQYQGTAIPPMQSVLEACFHQGLVPETSQRVFIPIQTPQTRITVEHTLERLKSQGWFQEGDCWEPLEIENGGEEAVRQIVTHMLHFCQPTDRVFVEPTNGLRSVSLALIFGSIYLQVLHPEVRVCPLVYGEFAERQGPGAETSVSALHRLGILNELGDWAQDAHAFGTFLFGQPLLGRMKSPPRSLPSLSAALAVGQVPYLMAEFRNHRPYPKSQDFAVQEALGFFERELAPLREAAQKTTSGVLNGAWLEAELLLAERFFKVGRLGDAARVMREWLVNVVLLSLGPDTEHKWYLGKGRKHAENWLGIRSGDKLKNSGTPEPWYTLAELGQEAQQIRNHLSHGGYTGSGEKEPPVRAERVGQMVGRARGWWDANRLGVAEGLKQPEVVSSERVFLNVSNHPSTKWSGTQRDAALRLGTEVVDLPFPEVPADEDDLRMLLDQILGQVPTDVVAAMVQGEPVLTVLVVAELQRRKIPCFTATSQRMVQVEGDKKTVIFHFDHFRPWPNLAGAV